MTLLLHSSNFIVEFWTSSHGAEVGMVCTDVRNPRIEGEMLKLQTPDGSCLNVSEKLRHKGFFEHGVLGFGISN